MDSQVNSLVYNAPASEAEALIAFSHNPKPVPERAEHSEAEAA